MTFVGPPGAIAPQISGVPSGLPEPRLAPRPDQKIIAPGKGDTMQGATPRNLARQDPSTLPQSGSDDEVPADTTPPTILQLKIDEMLREQAEKLRADQDMQVSDPAPEESGDTSQANVAESETSRPKDKRTETDGSSSMTETDPPEAPAETTPMRDYKSDDTTKQM